MSRLESELWLSKSRKDFAGFDVNNDGYIDQSDLAAQAEAVATAFGKSDQATAFLEANQPWFEVMMGSLGKGLDGRVNFEEYTGYWGEASEAQFKEVLEPWVASVLALAQNPSRLTKAEFATLSKETGGAHDDEVDGVFKALDGDTKGYLSPDEFARFMLEQFSEPGSF